MRDEGAASMSDRRMIHALVDADTEKQPGSNAQCAYGTAVRELCCPRPHLDP